MPTFHRPTRDRALRFSLSILLLLAGCGEQHEPRASPIVARPLGGDSIALGAVAKVCTPEDEACVPTAAVMCQEIWAGDPAEKPNMPPLSPREQAWCLGEGGTQSGGR
jgi:hypothetical protein